MAQATAYGMLHKRKTNKGAPGILVYNYFYYFKSDNKDRTKRYLCRQLCANAEGEIKECGASITTNEEETYILKVRGKDFLDDNQVKNSHPNHEPMTQTDIDKLLIEDQIKFRVRSEMTPVPQLWRQERTKAIQQKKQELSQGLELTPDLVEKMKQVALSFPQFEEIRNKAYREHAKTFKVIT
jgi:hypothetical protein